MKLKRLLKSLAIALVCAILIFCLLAKDKYVVPIMMYHHVSDNLLPKNLNVVEEKTFEYHMLYLKKHGFHVIGLDELVEGIQHKRKFHSKTVVITFDDGYGNNFSHAFPILKKYQFPATIFVISDLVGKTGYLTWPQMKEMMGQGISFGSHTRWHAYLPDLNEDNLKNEIKISKSIIEQNLGQPIKYFSYPAGGFTENIKNLVHESGYIAACTTNRGQVKSNQDLYELKRIRFNEDDYGLSLWAKLSGYYNLFRKVTKPN